jgi:hypothetical protein
MTAPISIPAVGSAQAIEARSMQAEKQDRAAFAGGPSLGRKHPGRAATRGVADLVFQIAKRTALMASIRRRLAFRRRISARWRSWGRSPGRQKHWNVDDRQGRCA